MFSSQTPSSVLCHYSCILVTNGYMTGFMSHTLYCYSCTVLCDYLFRVIDQCSCGKQCCNLVWFICEWFWDYWSTQNSKAWNEARLAKQKLEVGESLGCLETKANSTQILLGLQQLRGCNFISVSVFHFQFPISFPFSFSAFPYALAACQDNCIIAVDKVHMQLQQVGDLYSSQRESQNMRVTYMLCGEMNFVMHYCSYYHSLRYPIT